MNDAVDEPLPGKGPPGRGRRLIRPLQVAVSVVAALAAVAVAAGLASDGDDGTAATVATAAAGAAVAVVVAAPIGRLIFLAVRWWRLGDVVFARRTLALVGLVAMAAFVAWLL